MSCPSDLIPCRDVAELVSEYLDGALDAERRAAVEAHLDRCGWCRAYLEQIRITVRVVGDIPPESVDPALERGLLDLYRKLTKDDEG
ncbi:MAG TPA: zf-HC2 domain-containing protein [Baekduia sp.]|uniref:anti-sigma factor family protein n=1 Tax=Baekduia sp. TaxID=2600305 RepID=UPI002D7895BE|nr:zf-HC2 domain-containing protein [Baekduia sp.]HET6506603.1 zf-HC2 domain-containing protein [Baekduia sp.]